MQSDIVQLYRDHSRIKQLIPSSESAMEIAKELSISRGWRERCSAAVVVKEFGLLEQIPILIETFKLNPEINSCRCFTEMIHYLKPAAALQYLEAMKSACLNDERGRVLIRKIEDAINKLHQP